MNSKVICFVLLIAIKVNNSQGQFFPERRHEGCSKDSPCTVINNCPSMLALIRSLERDKILQVKKKLCGYSGSTPKVCCKEDSSTATSLLPPGCGKPDVIDRIVGGNITSRGAYPWMVAMGYEVRGGDEIQFLCSGTLINDRYVLTAAHCLDKNRLGTKKLQILHLGDWDLSTPVDCDLTSLGPVCSPPHTEAFVEKLILHPDYNTRAASSDDIALIRMDRAVQFRTEIKPICLPPQNMDVVLALSSRLPIATGWGMTKNNTDSDVLRKVLLPLNDNQRCINWFRNRFVGKQLCVGGKHDEDTCKGDSGGPLIIGGKDGPPYIMLGIVSFGSEPCGMNNVPAVYTSVSSYKNWIVENLRP